MDSWATCSRSLRATLAMCKYPIEVANKNDGFHPLFNERTLDKLKNIYSM